MQQKFPSPICKISNIRFEVMHKGKKIVHRSPSQKTNFFSTPSKLKNTAVLQGFIPINFTRSRKQLVTSLKFYKKQMLPLKPIQPQHQGFPVRKIKTSLSSRNVIGRKQKNFIMGEDQIPVFSNPKLNEMVKIEIKQKFSLPQYMSKSLLDNYHSNKSNNSSRIRRSLVH